LQSELLLRSEAPLEFLRRVAEGEALYMETRRSDPSEKNIYRMIISMGPELLGHSRLVILAALIFLSRLANQQNADLHWCVLPSKTENDPIWFTELSVNSVKRFLKYASYRHASALEFEHASETWDRVFAETLTSNSTINDWVIGSSTDRKPENPTLNIPNSLAISMSPPIGDVPRICELTLKRKSGRPHKVKLKFPPDVTCISALNRPFRPVIRSNPEARTGVSKLHGWEPLYHTALSAYLHVIRVKTEGYNKNGFLFFRLNYDLSIAYSALLELPDNIQIAGVNYESKDHPDNLKNNGDRISIVAQSDHQGIERIVLDSVLITRTKHGWSLHADMPSTKKLVSTHLFKTQNPYAIPIFYGTNSLRCYTTLGQSFNITRKSNDSLEFNINYKANRIFKASSRWNIFYNEDLDMGFLKPERKNSSPTLQISATLKNKNFFIPIHTKLDRNSLAGLIFSADTRTLAYSARSGAWHFRKRSKKSPLSPIRATVELPPDMRIIRSALNEQRVQLKLMTFSDVNFGGDGRLRNITFTENHLSSGNHNYDHQTLFDFGELAESLVALSISNEKSDIYGIELDKNGNPSNFIILNKKRGAYKKYKKTTINLTRAMKSSFRISVSNFLG